MDSATPTPRPSPTRKWAIAALVLAPPGLLAAVIWLYGVDMPLWDQWEILGRIDHVFVHGLHADDLLSPHHEHWMPIPLAIMIGMALTTGWNITAELSLNFLLGVGIFSIFATQAVRAAPSAAHRWSLLPIVSLLTFSVTQHNNWLWGLQVSSLLSMLAMVASLSLLTSQRSSWRRFAVAISLALVACSSQFHGNLVWPIGLVGLVLCRGVRGPAIGAILVWSACGAMVLIMAYLRLHTTENTSAALEQPLQIVGFVLAYVGSPLATHNDAAALLAGAIGLVIAVVFIRRSGDPGRSAFPIALLLLSMSAAAITAVGRLEHGLDTARASRYVTYASPFWIAVTMLSATARLPRLLRLGMQYLLVASVVASSILSFAQARQNGLTRLAAYNYVMQHRDEVPSDPAVFAQMLADPELLTLLQTTGGDLANLRARHPEQIARILQRHGLSFADSEHLQTLYPDDYTAIMGLIVLKKHHLSVFRDR